MKLEKGKIYKIEYITKEECKYKWFGVYEGLDFNENGLPCNLCGAENHIRGHQFNIYHSEDYMDYETIYFGTTCINKCTITESTREEMLNN